MVLSPLSLSTVLAMALGCASGETAAQMRQTLGLGDFEEDEPIHLAFQDVLGSMATEADGPSLLRLAYRLFLQGDVDVGEGAAALLEQHYASTVGGVDFAQDAEEARRTIDAWIAEQTEGAVGEMVGVGVLDLFSVLVLVSAVAFKGSWAAAFRTGSTELVPFQAGGGRQAMVDMMHCSGNFRQVRSEDLGCHAIQLPYVNGRLHMLVILPSDSEGLAALEAQLDADALTALVDAMEEAPLRVSLPRFRVKCHFSLSDVVAELGMADLFNPDSADLSNLGQGDAEEDDEGGLCASSLLHGASIEVDEGGEEEGAEGEDEGEEEFVADHPFLFIVRDVASQMVVLIGRLQAPALEELVL